MNETVYITSQNHENQQFVWIKEHSAVKEQPNNTWRTVQLSHTVLYKGHIAYNKNYTFY